MATSSTSTKPTIGILSIGDMGMGIAKLLRFYEYTVFTVAIGRRPDQICKNHQSPSDEALVAESDIILSIVPPRDSISTAKRIGEACKSVEVAKYRGERRKSKNEEQKDGQSLIYIDLNAISPRTINLIETMFQTVNHQNQTSIANEQTKNTPSVLSPSILTKTFSFNRTNSTSTTPSQLEEQQADQKILPIKINLLDGGIIGPPPRLNQSSSSSIENNNNNNSNWTLPSLVISGSTFSDFNSTLQQNLNTTIISPDLGVASTLKASFASLTKGLTALAILSFTTAHQANVLTHLTTHLQKYSPQTLELAQKGLTGMPPKAYRWVDEMIQIGETFHTAPPTTNDMTEEESAAAFPISQSLKIFEGISDLYRFVSEDTILGNEKVEKRKRGRDITDVAECIKVGLVEKKKARKRSKLVGGRRKSSVVTTTTTGGNGTGTGTGIGERRESNAKANAHTTTTTPININNGGNSNTTTTGVSRLTRRQTAGGSTSTAAVYGNNEDEDEEEVLDLAWRGSWT